MGPFDVAADQIERLGTAFTEVVNRLLDAEAAFHDLYAHQLVVTQKETTADGGVDAVVREALRTDWLPPGESAWQFKRSGPGPAACANEFAGSQKAQDVVRGGGSYVLVLGVDLNDKLLENRRKAIAAKAVDLGVLGADDRERIRVYGASGLARWISRFPSLAVSPLLGGPGGSAVAFESWIRSRWHQAAWVVDDQRAAAVRSLREQITSPGVVDVRVQGVSGIGKTRLVMEALREEKLRPLVAYVPDERVVGGELIAHVIGRGRTAILVVDDCPPERHVKLAEQLPNDPAVKLITIGDPGAATTRSPVIAVFGLPAAETDAFLSENYPQLGPEARRFIVDHTDGNTRWSIVFAERLVEADAAQAADLIRKNDIESFVTSLLPQGRPFFLATILALVERTGWDRELRPQLELLASFAGAVVTDMEDVGRDLEQRGLMTRQGRYRSVTPHPLAVFLAAEAWRSNGNRIIAELMPKLNESMALSLFRRVADLGQFEPARTVLPTLLGPQGAFSSLRSLEDGHNGELLTQLAIVLPDEVALHLRDLIQPTPLDQLGGYTQSRRDLVWTLEKLAWHRRTFATAADCLLRLAQAENETWANNATGTWIDLFGTWLPGTAASPSQRIEYLRSRAESGEPVVRSLVVKAATRMMAGRHEAITVSGELQGGVLVEPRGSPATWDEAGEYRRAAIALLDGLRLDPDASVAAEATTALIEAMHPLIDDPFVGDDLATVLKKLTGLPLDRLRGSVASLIVMQERHGEGSGRDQLVAKLKQLDQALPTPSEFEQFQLLLRMHPWELEEGELLARVTEAVRALDSRGDLPLVLRALDEEEQPAAWFIGRALGTIRPDDGEIRRRLMNASRLNALALVGYLNGLVERGAASAFDDFLDGPEGETLDASTRLSLTVRGPVTHAARDRVGALVTGLPVATGTRYLFYWQKELDDDETALLAANWEVRIASQEDYNTLIDWLNFRRPDEALGNTLREPAFRVLMRRPEFPALGQQTWDWSHLAIQLAEEHGPELANLVLDLVEAGQMIGLAHEQESQLLLRAAREAPVDVWQQVATRLEGGSWRLQLEIRGWLLHAVPVEVIDSWMGEDVDRARVVATVAPVGANEPTPIARLLLDRHGADDRVKSSLFGEYMTGTWSGPESGRLEEQIRQLNGWRSNDAEPGGVRAWAAEVIRSLESRRQQALEEEAERGF